MTKPSTLNRQLERRAMLLSQYVLQFLPQKVVKGHVLANSVVDNPGLKLTKLYEDLPDEVTEVFMTRTSFESQVWRLYFDGALQTSSWGHPIAGVEVVHVSSQDYVLYRAFFGSSHALTM